MCLHCICYYSDWPQSDVITMVMTVIIIRESFMEAMTFPHICIEHTRIAIIRVLMAFAKQSKRMKENEANAEKPRFMPFSD